MAKSLIYMVPEAESNYASKTTKCKVLYGFIISGTTISTNILIFIRRYVALRVLRP